MMGGRGSSSNILYRDRNGKFAEYGSEYVTIHQYGMVKYVKPRNSKDSVRVPEETRTKGRIYVTVGRDGQLKSITRYDKNGKKCIQIDLTHFHNGLKPHAHKGYNHRDGKRLSKSERALVDRIVKEWERCNGNA